MTPLSVAARFGAYSAAGWAIESAWRDEPAKSVIFGDRPIPLLPVYGAGAMLALGLAKGPLRDEPWWMRALSYGVALSLFELVSCEAGRTIYGKVNWGYADGQCVDLMHAAVWSGLGLALEHVDRAIFG